MRKKASIRPILSRPLISSRPAMPLLLLTGRREKGFNEHRRVGRNESLTLQEREFFFFILFLCHIKRALDSCKMLCNHLFAARWESSGGSLSHLPSLLQACCALSSEIGRRSRRCPCPRGAVSPGTEMHQEPLKGQDCFAHSPSLS